MSTTAGRLAAALSAFVLASLCTLTVPPASTAAPHPAAQSNSAGRLYVQTAANAVASRSTSGSHLLTLRDVDRRTEWFTDRPLRRAGSQATNEFVRQWRANGFASTPPNAVLEVGDDEGLPVTLRNPRYNARRGTLTYVVTPLNGRPLPPSLRNVALFIDNSGSVQQQVVFTVGNLTPGMQFQLSLSSDAEAVTFTGGPAISAAQPVPILSTSMTTSTLSIATGEATGSSPLAMQISVTITSETGPSAFALAASAAPGVSVSAQVGPTAPVNLTSSPTTFTWTS